MSNLANIKEMNSIFGNAHGIINALGLLQRKGGPKGFTLTLQETQSTPDSMNIPKVE